MESEHLPEQTALNNDDDKTKNDTVPESKSFWTNMTLEPLWFGVYISGAIDVIIFKNLYIERACLVDLNYPTNSCNILEALDPAIEKEAQSIISAISVNSGIISGLISCIMVLFLGPWSDSSGRRKPLMLFSAGTHILSSVCVLVMLGLPSFSVGWILYLKGVMHSFGGNLLSMAAYSYLGDICYTTRRCATIVMGRNGFASFLAFVTGSFFSPLVYRQIGFAGVISVSIGLQIFAFFYIYYQVQDLKVADKIPSVLDVSLPIKAFRCVFQKREGYKRIIILIMMIVPSVNMMIGANEVSLRYLYLRNTFSWSETDYGNLLTMRMVINSFGIWMIVNIFKQRLKFRDEIVGLIGGISETVDAIVFMNIKTTWMLYATAFFGILSSGPITVERPIINKFILRNEQGKIYSVISILEMVFTYSTVPLSNFVYSRTLVIFPSCYMFISIFGATVTVICYICIVKLCKLETIRSENSAKNCATNNLVY